MPFNNLFISNPVQEQQTYLRPNGTETEKERASFQHIYEVNLIIVYLTYESKKKENTMLKKIII